MQLFSGSAKYSYLLLALWLMPILAMAQLRTSDSVLVGAERPGAFLPILHGKKVAVVANQTSRVYEQHLVDFLIENKVAVQKVFAPEHGFRGTASAGEKIADGRDAKTGLPIISLYGSNKKPTAAQLAGVDIVIFDIQDVGARFYTYISTMSYVMEACAENQLKMLVLDRPNPHGYYIDGPILEPGFESFVGMHPVPVIHGMTIGEYARMVNGEGWLGNGLHCDLEVVELRGWDHQTAYELPVAPSPNLPNQRAIVLYPSLCFFEGTNVSIGRGTDKPFQLLGAPYFENTEISFVPSSREEAKYPKYEGETCYGFDLGAFADFYMEGLGELYLYWLTESYRQAPDKAQFFHSNLFFDKLAGTSQLRKDIMAGKSAADIHSSWEPGLEQFRKLRRKYLLYSEF